MGELISIQKYLETQRLETDYQEFLKHLDNKYAPPTTFMGFLNHLYLALRYLDGTVNDYLLFEQSTDIDYEYQKQLRESIIPYLEGTLNSIKENFDGR